MNINCAAHRAICLALLLTTTRASMASAQSLSLAPQQIPEGARNVRLKVQRADGRPFTAQSNAALSVGIAHGTRLVMFDARTDRPQSPRVLTVIIKDAGAAWSPSPRAGDNLLVAVYLNKRPITAATSLAITSGAQASSPGARRMIPSKTGEDSQVRRVSQRR